MISDHPDIVVSAYCFQIDLFGYEQSVERLLTEKLLGMQQFSSDLSS